MGGHREGFKKSEIGDHGIRGTDLSRTGKNLINFG